MGRNKTAGTGMKKMKVECRSCVMDGWMQEGQTQGQTTKASFAVVNPQLKQRVGRQ